MMASLLVIGYGNPLRGDDGVGPRVADELARSIRNEAVEILTCHQLTPELSEPVSRADLVIFIDASTECRPGEYSVRTLNSASGDVASFNHHLGPASLLAYAELLYGHAPAAVALMIGGQSFDYEERLSSPVASVLPSVVATARTLVAEFCGEQSFR